MESIKTTVTPLPYTVGPTILRVVGVNKNFDSKVILRDACFTVKDIIRENMTQGQIVSIIGLSGGGKTTLAKIIAGVLKPTSGQILVGDENPRPIKKGEVGFVFQDYIVFDHLCVYEYLLLAAHQGMTREHAEDGALVSFIERQFTWLTSKAYKLHWLKKEKEGDDSLTRFCKGLLARFLDKFFPKHALWEKVDGYLAEFGLQDHIAKHPKNLSGGQKQRLATLGQVLCSNQFIVFDEPFSGQDPKRRRKACEAIKKLAQMDDLKTLFIITHDIRSALWVSDTIIILGPEQDPASGQLKPGSTIYEPLDVAKTGLAWRDANILRDPEFTALADEIEYDWMLKM